MTSKEAMAAFEAEINEAMTKAYREEQKLPRETPPIPAPQHKIEVKATVDGKCPLCGVAVPSTHIHLCSPQHVERRKGQVWRLTDGRDKSREYTLSHRYGATRWACKGFGDCGLEDVCWEGRYEMELIADATAEPGKCEPWCGYGLPPDDVCGYGFIDGPGDEREYFKLPGKSQRRKGYVFSWCSNECREKAIAPNAKAPPAHETPKAAPVVVCIDCDTAPIAHPVPMRFVGLVHRARPICDDCYLARETHIGDHDYTPHSGPERLRTVLARDELVEWDCLEDA